MHECLLALLHRLIVLLDLLWYRCKGQIGLWGLISKVIEETHCLLLAIDA